MLGQSVWLQGEDSPPLSGRIRVCCVSEVCFGVKSFEVWHFVCHILVNFDIVLAYCILFFVPSSCHAVYNYVMVSVGVGVGGQDMKNRHIQTFLYHSLPVSLLLSSYRETKEGTLGAQEGEVLLMSLMRCFGLISLDLKLLEIPDILIGTKNKSIIFSIVFEVCCGS